MGFVFLGEKMSSSNLLNKTGARGIVIHIQAFIGNSSLQRDAVAAQGTFYLMPSGDTMVANCAAEPGSQVVSELLICCIGLMCLNVQEMS